VTTTSSQPATGSRWRHRQTGRIAHVRWSDTVDIGYTYVDVSDGRVWRVPQRRFERLFGTPDPDSIVTRDTRITIVASIIGARTYTCNLDRPTVVTFVIEGSTREVVAADVRGCLEGLHGFQVEHSSVYQTPDLRFASTITIEVGAD
jgi:hypothetical protein